MLAIIQNYLLLIVGLQECPLFHHILTLLICQIPAPFIILHIHFPQIIAEYTFYARGLLFRFSYVFNDLKMI